MATNSGSSSQDDYAVETMDSWWREYADQLNGYFKSKHKSHCGHDFEDLTGDLFQRALVALLQGARPEQALPWLFGVARNVVAEHRRHTQRQPRTVRLYGEIPNTSDETESSLAKLSLVSALEALTPSERRAFKLRFVNDLTAAEASARSGWTEKYFKKLVSTGRAKLRARLCGP